MKTFTMPQDVDRLREGFYWNGDTIVRLFRNPCTGWYMQYIGVMDGHRISPTEGQCYEYDGLQLIGPIPKPNRS